MSEYAEREIIDQKHYAKHVMAMTVEKLHCKGDIAAELAHRDEVIEALINQKNSLNDRVYKLRSYVDDLIEENIKLGEDA